MITLYHGLASTCSKKVRMCLYEKGIHFESRLLDLQKFEQHRPEYLALNPNGVVPTLVHNGRSVIESSIIVEYLDDAFPTPPLRPVEPYFRAQVKLWLKFSDDVAYNAVYAPTWMILSSKAMRGSRTNSDEKLLLEYHSRRGANDGSKCRPAAFRRMSFNLPPIRFSYAWIAANSLWLQETSL
jgi:glutathione S-transferase